MFYSREICVAFVLRRVDVYRIHCIDIKRTYLNKQKRRANEFLDSSEEGLKRSSARVYQTLLEEVNSIAHTQSLDFISLALNRPVSPLWIE